MRQLPLSLAIIAALSYVNFAQAQTTGPGGFMIENRAVAEGNSGSTVVKLRVSRMLPSTTPVTLNYNTQNGSATAGSDYVAANGTVTLTAAAPSAEIEVTVNGDTTVEPNEDFSVVLTLAGGPAAAPVAVGRVAIIDDDSTPPPPPNGASFFVRGSEGVREGNSGNTPMKFQILRSPQATGNVVVSYRTEGDTATSGTDFESATGTVTLTAAAPNAEVIVNVKGDTEVEPVERLKFIASDGATPPITQAVPGFIIDDDGTPPPPPTGLFAIPLDALAVEPATGESEARIGVRLSRPASAPITIRFQTADGATATAGTDYTGPSSGDLVFAAGETLKQITFKIKADTVVEPREFVKFNLSSTDTTVQLPRPFVQLSIVDRRENPPPTGTPTAFIVACKPFVKEDAGSARLIVKRVGATDAALGIKFATVDGTALAGSDYTATNGDLSWAAGNAEIKTIDVPILDDTPVEPIEFFRVKLTNAAGDLLPGRSQANIAILDNVDHFMNHDFDDLCQSEAEDGELGTE